MSSQLDTYTTWAKDTHSLIMTLFLAMHLVEDRFVFLQDAAWAEDLV